MDELRAQIQNRIDGLKNASVRRPEVEEAIGAAVLDLTKREKRFPISPSAALKSDRDLYYALVNYYAPGTIYEDPLEAKTLLTFEIGHVTETMLSKYIGHAFHKKYDKLRVTFGELKDKDGKVIPLSGELDDPFILNGTLYLSDYKTSGDYPFKLLEPKKGIMAPKEENVAQMQLYMHSDWGRKHNVNKTILIYFNKNNSELKCIEIAYDPTLADLLLKKLYRVWDNYLAGVVPPREYVLGVDWQADYSMFRTHDNKEFEVAPNERDVAEIKGDQYLEDYAGLSIVPAAEKKKFIKHVALNYGNKIIPLNSGQFFLSLNKDKDGLNIAEIGQSMWEAV